MPHVRPFLGLRYARRPDLDLSKLIAPPYDVLDADQKAALQARDPRNIVAVDLPHMPPKTLGPPEAYQQANAVLESWLNEGIIIQEPHPGLYPYMQTFAHAGRTVHRRGFFALVELSGFDKGHVVPHEKTYAGAIADRLALMQATRVQLSPVFALYSDQRHEVTDLLFAHSLKPESSATLDGVRHDLWSVIDANVINQVTDFLGTRSVYIADGHHRYTTALEYQAQQQAHGPLPPQHSANFCLFVLVSMQDAGLLVLPTHRLVGNMAAIDAATLKTALADAFDITGTAVGADGVADYVRHSLPKLPPHTIGLYDGRAKKLSLMHLKNPDLLAPFEPAASAAWRRLDVAILQRYVFDEIIQKRLAVTPTRGYTADPAQIAPQTDGLQCQYAFIVQATPLHALEELGRHHELMPQKSTYFFPKLATGLVINSLR